MNQRDIEYALAKQVPDMARGFTIATSYGDMVIEPGWVASIVVTHLERALRCELLELEGRRSNGKHLISPEQANALLAAGFDQHGGAYEPWSTRKVDVLLQVQFGGLLWSVRNMPSVHVGDLVRCRPGAQADVLLVSTGDPEHPTAYAQRVDSADQEESGLPKLPDELLFGRSYVHRPAPAPAPAAWCVPCGALVCPRCGAQQPPATGATA